MRVSQPILRAILSLWAIIAFVPQLPAQNSSSSHVAIVDLKLAYDNMQATIDTRKQVAGLQEQLDKLVQFHRAGPDAKNPPTDLHEQTLKVKIVRVQARQLVQAYGQIQAVVAELAKAKGFDLVLVGTSPDLPANAADIANPQTLAGVVFNRGVLYAANDIDITADVISQLNRNYKSPTTAETVPSLPTTRMQIGVRNYQLEIAGDDASWERGLMDRDSMAADHGMIFVFPDSQMRSFWMHHTRFPLDIIFADENGKVVSTSPMKAYDESNISSDFPAKYAVELNAGEVAASGVKPGDVLKIPAAVDAALKK